ncbi:hypothetical protein EPI10_019991 [Gossypium australe]|uniref:Uncharacterized protein n=1 Tax=Gossypium australe TaxID=47621 RepID=A0A5B6WDY5_9ROSI|nr:hypothetical protein EPI10_019991 [Gossypium australe]
MVVSERRAILRYHFQAEKEANHQWRQGDVSQFYFATCLALNDGFFIKNPARKLVVLENSCGDVSFQPEALQSVGNLAVDRRERLFSFPVKCDGKGQS